MISLLLNDSTKLFQNIKNMLLIFSLFLPLVLSQTLSEDMLMTQSSTFNISPYCDQGDLAIITIFRKDFTDPIICNGYTPFTSAHVLQLFYRVCDGGADTAICSSPSQDTFYYQVVTYSNINVTNPVGTIRYIANLCDEEPNCHLNINAKSQFPPDLFLAIVTDQSSHKQEAINITPPFVSISSNNFQSDEGNINYNLYYAFDSDYSKITAFSSRINGMYIYMIMMPVNMIS